MKLSKRLSLIAQWAEQQTQQQPYDHIWDCCCDHGYLGTELLERIPTATIHFVDVVAHLIEDLTQRLRTHHTQSTKNWQTHCLDVADLPLAHYAGRHLVMIAGIGGDLMTTFIEEITRRHPNLEIDLIVCPIRHHYTVRRRLMHDDYRLLRESLIEENQRYYEVLSVSNHQTAEPVHPIGYHIWHATEAQQQNVIQRYYDKTLAHYERLQRGGNKNIDKILAEYYAIRWAFD
ncbi:tRNA (adenine(22)-N(1))-methyltransferase [Vibrio palustris]|uniref:Uncharacterized protein n=1 Tax=Vibrio palustris TaxID=1918946 RepID=A0A1R4B5I8_9VIBR|nr:tRNA (adenine(22)-N(1))-methyltransferase TrmK [Vibrio palustris]SJL84184.1 hypothetical protein VPAL9027_02166 [Vibrio palustris]